MLVSFSRFFIFHSAVVLTRIAVIPGACCCSIAARQTDKEEESKIK